MAAQEVSTPTADPQAQKVTAITDKGKNVDINIDEGGVYNDPNKIVFDNDEIVGMDQGGVYGVGSGVPVVPTKVTKAKKESSALLVYTNTRSPNEHISVVRDNGEGEIPTRTGKYIEFSSTKAYVKPNDAAAIKLLDGRSGIFREPADFAEAVASGDKRVFRHTKTGFMTMDKKAFEEWINNSEFA